jgi:hypothetical protein
VQDGKYSKGGKPKQMTLCSAERTNSSIPDQQYFVKERKMPANIMQGVEQRSGGFIGTFEWLLQHNRKLYKAGHRDATAAVRKLLWLARTAADDPDEVITTKQMMPPTGDKRTYVSLATYCWPPNGDDLAISKEPWTCIDGKPFPEVLSPLLHAPPLCAFIQVPALQPLSGWTCMQC